MSMGFRNALMLLLSAMVLVLFSSCNEDTAESNYIEVGIDASKTMIYTGESLSLSSSIRWLREQEDMTVSYEWSCRGDAARIEDGTLRNTRLEGLFYGQAEVFLKATVHDAAGRRVSVAASDGLRVLVLPRLDMKSGERNAVDFLSDDLKGGITSDTVWQSTETSVATIDDNGAITAVSQGSTEIFASNGDELVASFNLDVAIPVTGVSLNVSSKKIQIGEKLDIRAFVEPEDATDRDVVWSCPDIVSIRQNESGDSIQVEGNRIGSGLLTATTRDGGFISSIDLKVVNTVKVSKINLTQSSLSLRNGQMAVLVAAVKPENALVKDIIWQSSDDNVVSITPNGKVCIVRIISLPEPNKSYAVRAISPDGVEAACNILIL